MKSGTYYIKLYNQNNQGKYSLAVGGIETFPPNESLNALFLLPLLKADIFGVPVAELFLQFLGLILGMGTFLALTTLIIKSKKSEEVLKISNMIKRPLRMVLWVGVIIKTIMGLYNFSKNTSDILGIVTTIFLAITIILTLLTDIKLIKMVKNKVPYILSSITLIFWIIFLF